MRYEPRNYRMPGLHVKVIYPDGTPGELPDLAWLSIAEPVPGPITQAFGVRSVTSRPGEIFYHRGEDRAPGSETPIRAVRSGRVRSTYTYGRDMPGLDSDGSPGGYGNQVTLDHEKTVQSHYAHIREGGVLVRYGDWVSRGDIIGYIGSTGISSGPHLHYELRFSDGTRFDPEPYYSRPPEDDMAGFTDDERAALHRLAALDLEGKTFAPGAPGRSVLIGLMNTYRDLPDDASRQRFDRRMAALVRTLGLDQDAINALPTPKYGTLKPWAKDLQERVQE